jgi:pectinesterase
MNMKKLFFLSAIALIVTAGNAQRTARIIVAKDGTGRYTTVQEALDAVPLNNTIPVEIFIKKGTYKEKLHLDSTKNNVHMIGEDVMNTILTYDDHTGTVAPYGSIINTMTSQSFCIKANDFKAENITFQNNAGLTAGQAVAIRVQGDRIFFLNCRMVGFQDTLFTSDENSREFYKSCYIEGSTDFIFGAATALFEDCIIHSKKNSHITAASTPKEHAYGYVFKRCRLESDTGLAKVSLGRPWRPYASVTYMECVIGAHILPQGWDNWKNPENEKTARYAEYKNRGPGSNTAERFAWTKQLTDEEAKQYTTENILRGWQPYKKR